MNYFEMSKAELDAQLKKLEKEYADYKEMKKHSTELTAEITVFWTVFPE